MVHLNLIVRIIDGVVAKNDFFQMLLGESVQ